MAEWREVTLGDVLTLQRGFDLPARDREDGPVPVVSSSGVTGRHSVAKVDPPGVVIGRYGSLGSVHWVEEPFWPLNTTLWVKDFKGNDPRFTSYLLKTIDTDGGSAAAVPGVNRNHLHRLLVRLPLLRSQRRIAAVLSAFEELMAMNQQRAALLESLVSRIYHEWFGRFRTPGREHTVMTRSPLGLIPKGWEIVQLGDIVELRYGKALPANARRPGQIAVVSSAGVIDQHDQALAEGPGIVIGRKGNVGSVWWVDGPFFPIDTTYFVETEAPLGLVYWQLRNASFIDSHAAIPGLSRDQASRLLVLRPPRELAEQFDRLHRACFAAIASLRERDRRLASTRDILLPRLVSGRLDISDVDLGILTPAEAAA